MNLEELVDSFRTDADDHAKPYLWTGADLARWFTEAEAEAAIRRRLLPDEAEIPLVIGQRGYPFQQFFEITSAALVYTAAPYARRCHLRIVSRDAMEGIDPHWRERPEPPGYLIQDDTRVVLAGAVSRAGKIVLEGLRTPAQPFRDESDSASPEIAEVHHRFLVHWALHRAYGKQDADTFDPQRSALELAKFEQYFGLRPDADLRKDARADQPHHVAAFWP